MSKENSKEKILQTATALFAKQGYHATGMNQILKESGAPKGSLYYHFPQGKEQLAAEAVNRITNKILQETSSVFTQSRGVLQAFEDLMDYLATHIVALQLPPTIPLMALESPNIGDSVRKACKECYDMRYDLFTQKLLEEYELQEAQRYSFFLITCLEGCLMQCILDKSTRPLLLLKKELPWLFKINNESRD